MASRAIGGRRRWGAAAIPGVVLLVTALVPLPHALRRATGPIGPDKALHLLGHAWFAAALVDATADRSASHRSAVLAVLVSTAYGFLTERIQEGVPGRGYERADVVAGLVGSVVGVVVVRRRNRTRGLRSRRD